MDKYTIAVYNSFNSMHTELQLSPPYTATLATCLRNASGIQGWKDEASLMVLMMYIDYQLKVLYINPGVEHEECVVHIEVCSMRQCVQVYTHLETYLRLNRDAPRFPNSI